MAEDMTAIKATAARACVLKKCRPRALFQEFVANIRRAGRIKIPSPGGSLSSSLLYGAGMTPYRILTEAVKLLAMAVSGPSYKGITTSSPRGQRSARGADTIPRPRLCKPAKTSIFNKFYKPTTVEGYGGRKCGGSLIIPNLDSI